MAFLAFTRAFFDISCYTSSSMDFYFEKAPEDHIRREKAKARELRDSQWWRQQVGTGKCHYCGEKFEKSELTMDHMIPIVRGGKSSKSNVVVSCKPCNNAKKYFTPAEMAMNSKNIRS
jgi:5-methylcytosine-specific restriction protein A